MYPIGTEKKTFWGYTAIGFIAMAGGIVMFTITVPKWNSPAGQAPADLTILFTKVYSIQANLRSANLPFSPDISYLGIDQETCSQYSCSMKLIDSGKDYEMRLSKGGRTWNLTSKSMVPQEIKVH